MSNSVSAVDIENSLYNSSVQRKANGELDKNAFLYILTAELSNQDPTNASDSSTEYIAQLAQFSALEQMQNLSDSMSKLLTTDKMMNGAVLIGMDVQFQVGNSDPVVETVKSVKAVNGDVVLITDKGNSYTFDQISQIDMDDNIHQLPNNGDTGDDVPQSPDNGDAGGVQNDNQSGE